MYFVLDRYNFYPRPPRGGRHPARHRPVAQQRFLSTPSARRATSISMSFAKAFLHFYPRPPRGGRLEVQRLLANASVISIHALREEGDNAITAKETPQNNFYPRPPRGGRRFSLSSNGTVNLISIHALREEGDNGLMMQTATFSYFYPRPPRGGRRIRTLILTLTI